MSFLCSVTGFLNAAEQITLDNHFLVYAGVQFYLKMSSSRR